MAQPPFRRVGCLDIYKKLFPERVVFADHVEAIAHIVAVDQLRYTQERGNVHYELQGKSGDRLNL